MHSAPLFRTLIAATCVVGFSLPALSQAVPAAPSYDVVSVKPNKTGSGSVRVSISPDGFNATNISVKSLLQNAYALKTEEQISGLPSWANSANFDIQAKAAPELIEAIKKLPRDEGFQQRRLLMQSLLADRFQLKIHHEMRELPMYALVVAKGGPSIKPSDPADTYPNGIKGADGKSHGGMMTVRDGQMDAQGIPLSNLADNLSNQLHRQVVDKTGLTGNYDLSLHWSPDELAADSQASGAATSAPSLFTALQEQLGLKLESLKGPVDTIVVDHIEVPSEN